MDGKRAGTVAILYTDVERPKDLLQMLDSDKTAAFWRIHFELLHNYAAVF